ncbi:MAG: tetratricopeptide repeat protein [Lentisphaerae bacterium]|nr:tetratricopeptide repeat protein [Lentisphaerota bacterium]
MRAGGGWRVPCALIVLGAAVYANSFRGVFLYDDATRLLDNPAIRSPLTALLRTSRPVTMFSFYLNHAAGGMRPFGVHLVNLCIHLAAALLLYAIVHDAAGRAGTERRRLLAGAAAALWMVHPVQTESVTYMVQRAESLAGLWVLATLYLAVRGARAGRAGHRWYTAAIVCCALGMGSKPVAVTAPVLVVLHDRLFLAGSFRGAWRARRGLYLGLAATWLIPAALLAVPHESATSAGFEAGVATPWRYALTQTGVIVHYLRLAVWPVPLCLDYGWPLVERGAQVWVPALCVGGLLVLSVWGYARRWTAGYAGLWFLIALAPTSSVVPIADHAAEHRLYLALGGPAVLFTAAVYGAVCRAGRGGTHAMRRAWGAGVLVLGAAIVALGAETVSRNRDYHARERMFRSVLAVRPDNFRAAVSLSNALVEEGRAAEAEALLRRTADRIVAGLADGGARFRTSAGSAGYFYPVVQNALGRVLLYRGELEEAGWRFEQALEARPDYAVALHNLAVVRWERGARREAECLAARALRLKPDSIKSRELLERIARERAGTPAKENAPAGGPGRLP